MSHDIYAYAKLCAAGLGNLLFPWGRCEVFRARHRLPMLAPRWTYAKIGPLLRREKDKRYYTGLFSHKGYVSGLKRWWLLKRAQRIAEADAEQFMAAQSSGDHRGGGSKVIAFEGVCDLFEPLLGHRELLHNRLHEILSPRVKQRLAPLGAGPVIGVHVRHGDKFVVEAGPRRPAGFLYRIPDDWFVTVIKNLRQSLGSDAPVVLFTDARPNEVQSILDLPNVSLAEENPSIADILRLAQAQVMIGTSTSTFGMWSAYLGAMPSIWYPSEHTFTLTPDKLGFQITADLDGSLPEGCVQTLQSAMGEAAAATVK
jgi:hypothetical protein